MIIVLKNQFHNFGTTFLKNRLGGVTPTVHKIRFKSQFFDEFPPTQSSRRKITKYIAVKIIKKESKNFTEKIFDIKEISPTITVIRKYKTEIAVFTTVNKY